MRTAFVLSILAIFVVGVLPATAFGPPPNRQEWIEKAMQDPEAAALMQQYLDGEEAHRKQYEEELKAQEKMHSGANQGGAAGQDGPKTLNNKTQYGDIIIHE